MKPKVRPEDERWMRRALDLAARAHGDVRHYPMVGAVVVKNGMKVAEGWFRKPGEPHAEINAFKKARDRTRGATLYVSLEPCSHFGRTPPCADAVVTAGIKRVVAGMTDPNPLVSGKGFAKCRAAGIEVVSGVLEDECRELNRVFVKFITTSLPWVTLKLAATLDGKIATRTGDSKWITGEEARKEAHKLRDVNQAVMVGAGTVRADDPELTVRMTGKGRHPRPVIVSSHLAIPPAAKALKTPAEGGAIIFTTKSAPAAKVKALQKAGAEVVVVKKGRGGEVDLHAVMKELGKCKIASVMIEGGAALAGSALRAGIVDEAVIFLAPKLLGGGVPMTLGPGPAKMAETLRLDSMRMKMVGADIMISGKVVKP